MTCRAADAEPAGPAFCGACGTPLALACPACGAANPPGQRFCGECGGPGDAGAGGRRRRLATPRRRGDDARPARSRSGDSSRSCSPTSSASRRSPRSATRRTSARPCRRYFDLAREVVGRYGGTVEKFIGDAVMAVWGAPIAHEDDAERAVRAALELVDAVRALGPGIDARAGVLTGEAAVTLGATNQGMVAGDIVNTAARLQSVAPPGTVLVGEATYRAAARRSRSRRPASTSLKGKAAPGAGVAGAAGRRGARRPRPARRCWRRRSSAATRSCGCSRTCSTRPRARAGPPRVGHRARPASARAASPGSSRSTSTASWTRLVAPRALARLRRRA